jgi:hypothetical protein
MTKNQKIALGCGGAGCLGLIVLAIAGGVGFWLYNTGRLTTRKSDNDYNFNVRSNDNSNSNANVDSNLNLNDNDNSNDSSSPSATMSDDDKHRLFQAASMTGDSEVVDRVSIRIGLLNSDHTAGPVASSFPTEHVTWAANNLDFIQSINTPAKARAYVDAHIND